MILRVRGEKNQIALRQSLDEAYDPIYMYDRTNEKSN
jgi:hypothetical protein